MNWGCPGCLLGNHRKRQPPPIADTQFTMVENGQSDLTSCPFSPKSCQRGPSLITMQPCLARVLFLEKKTHLVWRGLSVSLLFFLGLVLDCKCTLID